MISKDLNNTPNVTMKSYIYSGLQKLFVLDPKSFKNSTIKSLVRRFDPFDGDLSILKLEKLLNYKVSTLKPIKVLFISNAGAESLDLKNTTDVILMSPVWSPGSFEQIIGRAQRYKCCKNKVINCNILVLEDSIDEHVLNTMISKNENTQELLEYLKKKF